MSKHIFNLYNRVVFCTLLLIYCLSNSPNLWAEDRSNKTQRLFGESSLMTGQVSQSRIPLFSSIDGYVSFLLSADIIKPAKRKLGIFTIPKHGLVVENLSLDFRDVKITGQDWLKVLEMLEPLKAMSMLGHILVLYI